MDIRDHGGSFGNKNTSSFGTYISYKTEAVKSVPTTATDYLLGVAYDENKDRYYILTSTNTLKVFNNNLNLISSTTLSQKTTDILYSVSFRSYGVFIAKDNRIFLTGYNSNYPVIAEVSIDNAGIPTLVKVLQYTASSSQTYITQWELSESKEVLSSIGWTGTVVHYDLELNVVSSYQLNNSVSNSSYKGDINFNKGLTGFVQSSNNQVLVKDNTNKTVISAAGNSYSCCRIQNNFTFILIPNSNWIEIYENKTFTKVASINVSALYDPFTLFVTYNRNDDFVYAICPAINKVFIVDAISGSTQCITNMPFTSTNGSIHLGQKPFLSRTKFICSALDGLSFKKIEITTQSRKVGKTL